MVMRFFPRSIRARLTAIATAIAALVLFATSTFMLVTVPDNLRDVVRDRVEVSVRRVAGDARAGELSTAIQVPARVHFLEVVTPSGDVIATTPGRAVHWKIKAFRPAEPDKVYVKEIWAPHERNAGETHFLVMAMSVPTPNGLVAVYGASSLTDVDRAIRWFEIQTFIVAPLILASVMGITWLVVGFALRPVERIRSKLAEITGQDLSRRVPVPDTGDEITDLAATTNDTLDRLERSAETQRRFVADASHELRSPIAALRTQLEVANAIPEETDWRATGARALATVDRLTGIIDELLMLARLDAGAVAPRRVVDMCRLAVEQVRRRKDAGVAIVPDLCASAPVHGSPVQLDRILTNLLDNATRHADTRIDLEVAVEEGRRVVVTVTDDGEGIAPEDRERVFERFFRLDSAKAKDQSGSGLGLPLSREIALSHGGTLTIADHAPGARFVLVLPRYQGA
ncbi:HAMP domain-containing histidine kinase [Nonomuraea mesophila]|uniref:histidine kinase n=2 Tax=Nonomuraea mesophila TaxID=2530382 RepID=A0A4R5FY90_9ACTN|nr:HAMP domain-containing histidine kinase [Nonomuraea mesophila]